MLNEVHLLLISVNSLYEEDRFQDFWRDIHRKSLNAFRQCVEPHRRLFVLDWQHVCYSFDPHAAFDPDHYENWCIPVFPDGDYCIFLAEDFSFGTFGHPWEETICVFGKQLISL